jgi:hypothetical protein
MESSNQILMRKNKRSKNFLDQVDSDEAL